MKQTKTLQYLLLSTLLLSLSLNAHATRTLPEAKAELAAYKEQGKVGEKLNGFLAALNPRKKTQRLVKLINQARLKKFQQIALDNNFSVQEVEALAGPISIQKSSKGHYIQQNGQWVKK